MTHPAPMADETLAALAKRETPTLWYIASEKGWVLRDGDDWRQASMFNIYDRERAHCEAFNSAMAACIHDSKRARDADGGR